MTGRGREYASALMELALENNCKDEMYESLSAVRDVFSEEPGYMELLLSPAIHSEERTALVREAFGGTMNELVVSFLCVLTEKGHIRDFEEAFNTFEEMYKDVSNKGEATVTTAVELTDEQKRAMKAALEKKTGKSLEITYRTDKRLIGGVVAETDGTLMDGSLKTRLKEIKEVMEQ